MIALGNCYNKLVFCVEYMEIYAGTLALHPPLSQGGSRALSRGGSRGRRVSLGPRGSVVWIAQRVNHTKSWMIARVKERLLQLPVVFRVEYMDIYACLTSLSDCGHTK